MYISMHHLAICTENTQIWYHGQIIKSVHIHYDLKLWYFHQTGHALHPNISLYYHIVNF